MDADHEQFEVIRRIRARFPDEARQTDAWLVDRGYDSGQTYAWVEAFADRVAEAVRALEGSKVRAHTDFMAGEYRAGSEHLRALVDVAYAENIMWDLEEPEKVWAWSYIAEEIKMLYESMWGIPGLDGTE